MRLNLRRRSVSTCACLILGFPLFGGCVLDKPAADAPPNGRSSRAVDEDVEKPRHEQCEHTMEGTEAKTFCY